jgi:hypothetical protein
MGNPGRIVGWMCVCANRISFSHDREIGRCPACRRTYCKNGNEVILDDQRAFARSQDAILSHPV